MRFRWVDHVMSTLLTYISGWWFHPIPKILVRLNHHPQHMETIKKIQTTNQILSPQLMEKSAISEHIR